MEDRKATCRTLTDACGEPGAISRGRPDQQLQGTVGVEPSAGQAWALNSLRHLVTSSSVQTEDLLRSLPYFFAQASFILVTHSSTPPAYASGKVTFHVPVGVPVGELLCLCGPNGPGKSTLLEMRKHWQLLLPLRFETAKDIGERAEHELAEPSPTYLSRGR